MKEKPNVIEIENDMIWHCTSKMCNFIAERWIKTRRVISCPRCNSTMQPEVRE